jgi:hypothetical protein
VAPFRGHARLSAGTWSGTASARAWRRTFASGASASGAPPAAAIRAGPDAVGSTGSASAAAQHPDHGCH